MNTALVWSTRFAEHDTGSHPESPERIFALERALRGAGMFDDRLVVAPEPIALEAVGRLHSAQVIDRVRFASESGGGWLDADTYVSPASFEIGLLAAGAACQAVDIVLNGDAPRAFALVRPPGHHAEPLRSMGFCLFNNIALAAMHTLDQPGVERVAIIDWDVHHGNGTQSAFWSNPHVFFASVHQYPFYPGTGSATERGAGDGLGTTLNVPLPAGCDDAVYLSVFDEQIMPAVAAFEPDVLLISAGFDAHNSDPLAMMRMTTAGFTGLARRVNALAAASCGGRLVLVLEGGYNLNALGECVVAVLRALDAGS